MTGTTLPETIPAPPVAAVAVDRVPVPVALEGSADCDSLATQGRLRNDLRLPACLISTIVHTVILLLLALFTYHGNGGRVRSLIARQGELAEVLSFEPLEPQDNDTFDERAMADQPITVAMDVVTPTSIVAPVLDQAESAFVDPDLQELAALAGGASSQIPMQRLQGSGGLSRRTPEGRLEYGKKYGATRESEEAVEAALAWIAAHQRDNGSWSFNLELDPCNGQCRNSKKKGAEMPTPSTGATGLALLAFLGAGHTHHRDGPYRETVRRGIYYLRSIAADSAAGYDWQQGSMYGHGIAVMALSEALAMTTEGARRDSDLVEMVALGASFTSVAQHDSGSWGYVPGSPGDITLTGWQVLSLIAAKKNRIALHSNTLSDAKAFVLSTCTDRDYWFGYKGPPGEPTTTAIGLTLMLYLGQSPEVTPFYMALTRMAERGPTLTNIYHDYYATLALHHSRHRDWDRWNTKLRDHLVATQAKSGHEQGSWHFPDRWGDVGGRLYTTAMCAMTLEIYYRYMPLYESIDKFPL